MKLEPVPPDRSSTPLGAIFGGVLALSALMTAVWLWSGLPLPVCHFRQWTGLPCLTCGSTRLAESLLAGHPVEAFLFNPLVFVGLSLVAVWAVLSATRVAFGLSTWRLVLGPRERLGARILASAALVVGWAYLIWRGV